MIRQAFVMSVNPGQEAEYAHRHQPIWPELERTPKEHGVHNYSIFLCASSRQLFAYAEIESPERWKKIAQTEVCQRWWRSMSPLMPSGPDHRPISEPLREVFHLD